MKLAIELILVDNYCKQALAKIENCPSFEKKYTIFKMFLLFFLSLPPPHTQRQVNVFLAKALIER